LPGKFKVEFDTTAVDSTIAKRNKAESHSWPCFLMSFPTHAQALALCQAKSGQFDEQKSDQFA